MKKVLLILAVFSAVLTLNSCQKLNEYLNNGQPVKESKSDAAVAVDWYKLELRIFLERNSTMNPANFAYLGIGLYEAVRGETKNSVSFSSKLNQMPLMPEAENKAYDWVISANSAMASILRKFNIGLTPVNLASIDSLENLYNQHSSADPNSEKFVRSQIFGRNVATAVYNWYLTDNLNASNVGYVPPVFPGAWEPTPPAFLNGINPFISSSRLFLSANASVVVPPPPFLYSENSSSDYYKMVQKVYDVNQTLSTEQKNIANFWIDQGNGVGYTPAGHDFSILSQIITKQKPGLVLAAEAFAKAGIANRDGTIVCFTAKYKYNQMRPVTYIQRFIKSGWLPFIPTPPHPEYPAAHSFVTGSDLVAASWVLGKNTGVTDHTYDFRGWTPRTYATLYAAAEEAGISRLYGGIHYIPSINTGLDMAKLIGNNIGSLKMSY